MQFSQQHADAACNFFEHVLKHTADEWWGKPFILAPWQEEALGQIFGWIDDDGNPIIKMAYLEVPKKAGKTEWVAGVIVMALVLTNLPGCQVYGAAASQRQAGNVYRAACKMVEQSPILKARLRILRGTNRIIKRSDPDSFYAAIAGDGDLSDGVNPSVFVADEVHRWRARKHIENWDVLSKGGITRKHTLTIGITTAGVQNESPLAWRLHEKAKRIQKGIVADATFYGRIYSADPEDDWTDEKTWIKANPSLKQNGGFLDISKIRAEYESTLSDPAGQSSFRRYFLNLWDEKEGAAVPMAEWDACLETHDWRSAGLLAKPPEDKVRPLPHDLMKRFIERRCWVGVDLSMTTDLSAVTFVFPRDDKGYDLLPFFWIPEDGISKREVRDGVPYREWARQGLIEICPGGVIEYRDVKARLLWGDAMFNLQEMCFDPWNSGEMSAALTEEGHVCVKIRQGFPTLSEPTKKFLSLVRSKKIGHGGNPVLRWNVGCLSAEGDGNDNLKFDKPVRSKNTARIDGVSAAVNALARIVLTPERQPSVYETRGILTV